MPAARFKSAEQFSIKKSTDRDHLASRRQANDPLADEGDQSGVTGQNQQTPRVKKMDHDHGLTGHNAEPPEIIQASYQEEVSDPARIDGTLPHEGSRGGPSPQSIGGKGGCSCPSQ